MCKFKSGIILKGKCVLSKINDNSHTSILEELEIEDTAENAARVFVRAELSPKKDEWWTDVSTWNFKVDQDIVPDWFTINRDEYEQRFRDEVKEWISIHVLECEKIESLDSGFYLLFNCEVAKLSGNVRVMMKDTTVEQMTGKAFVITMNKSSVIKKMEEDSVVKKMCDNSKIERMTENSTVRMMTDNSLINELYGSSKSGIYSMHDKATVNFLSGKSKVMRMYDESSIKEMMRESTVTEMTDDSSVEKMKGKTSIVLIHGYSKIGEMSEDASIQFISEGAKIKRMRYNSEVKKAENIVIESMEGSSVVYTASGNTTIKKMAENAVALSLMGNSSVESMADDAMATNHEKGIIYKSKEALKVIEI